MRIATTIKKFAKIFFWRLAPVYSRQTWVKPAKRNFAIGIYSGNSPFTMQPSASIVNPVLTSDQVIDVPARCVADPFMIRVDGIWYMFFEVENQISMKGEIALATSKDALTWTYQQIVHSEPWHLSYPYVFELQGSYFMIPESAQNKKVTLYAAQNFPYEWKPLATLLEGNRFADSSIFEFDNRWWMLVDTGPNSKGPVLSLFYAADLFGPWNEHPASPILVNEPKFSRPGGRVVQFEGRPVRFTQEVFPEYGKKLSAFEITELTESNYKERRVGVSTVLGPGQDTWNSNGMHHIDAHQLADESWIACVDGY